MEGAKDSSPLYLYLDQNVIQYAFEGTVVLEPKDSVTYVFSKTHFDEIDRKVDGRFFETLNRLRARQIAVNLDEKFRMTGSATIAPFEETEGLFKRHIETVSPHRENTDLFTRLQPFFMGNTNSVDPSDAGEALKRILMKPIENFDSGVVPDGFKEAYETAMASFAKNFSGVLETAKQQIKPIEESRGKFTKTKLSNLDPKDGPIVDQIWEFVKGSFPGFTKDQIFGKEPLPTSEEKNVQPFLSVVQCHTMLNTLGYWPDEGLKKVNKAYGIQSDAAHIANAIYCHGIISADDRLCKKAMAIYEYLGTNTAVLQVRFVEKEQL